MPASDAAAAVMLDAVGAVAVWISLHSSDPGTTGANELAGGTPAYARQEGAWDPASGRVIALSGAETFDVPGPSSVAFFGTWDASSGGTFYVGGALSAVENYTGQGTYVLTGAQIAVP